MYVRGYELQNTWLDQCLKTAALHYPSKSNLVNGSNLLRYEQQHLHRIYWWTSTKLSCKKSLLVTLQNLQTVS